LTGCVLQSDLSFFVASERPCLGRTLAQPDVRSPKIQCESIVKGSESFRKFLRFVKNVLTAKKLTTILHLSD
jgi:hypothetical protein